jgi:hypothetical protein
MEKGAVTNFGFATVFLFWWGHEWGKKSSVNFVDSPFVKGA